MKLIAQVKLAPTEHQLGLLKYTLETANIAANYISDRAWSFKTFGQYALHHLCYYDVRKLFGLSAQATVRIIAKVASAYKLDCKHKRIFKPLGAIPYDERNLHWYLVKQTVSIWLFGGRQHVKFLASPRQLEMLKSLQGEAELIYRSGEFYLHQVCDVETPDPYDPKGWIGVDMGIVNIVTDSDGQFYSGKKVNGLRYRHAKLRAKLQSKGTKSAKRLLKKRRGKESRFAKDVNHCISKGLVEKAKDTERGIALEDLTGIRERVTVCKSQRRQHHSWSFSDLRQKIEYKGRQAGIPVISVDPCNTSRTCPVCGYIDKRNRPNQSTFLCVSCGFSGHADHIAALNISGRATVNWPHVPVKASGELVANCSIAINQGQVLHFIEG